jgi:hypothetical protein
VRAFQSKLVIAAKNHSTGTGRGPCPISIDKGRGPGPISIGTGRGPGPKSTTVASELCRFWPAGIFHDVAGGPGKVKYLVRLQ